MGNWLWGKGDFTHYLLPITYTRDKHMNQGHRIQSFGISLLAIAFYNSSTIAAPLTQLDNWRFNPKTLQLEITLSAGTTPNYFYLAQPPRLVVDIPNSKLGQVRTQQNYSGAIRSIRVSQLNATMTRIVLDLAPGRVLESNQVQLKPISSKNPTRWVLSPVISHNSTSSKPISLPTSPNNPPLTTANPQQPLVTVPPPSNNQPNSQQPFVTVPPLTPQNSSQLPNSILPPATFPNQSGNLNKITVPNNAPNVPNSQNSPNNVPDIKVIEFGQPLPKD
ncbi:hypothetical protein NIES4074_50260 [Cylindrospermum sp. NIES-4074]|nr:hypothetical protein NIES4074_50260 [Cylindrospermum sp. NIES-4074]